jgi:hypothetical protein
MNLGKAFQIKLISSPVRRVYTIDQHQDSFESQQEDEEDEGHINDTREHLIFDEG